MLILRGAWAGEDTYTLEAKVDGEKAKAGEVTWKVENGWYHRSVERGGFGFVQSDLSDADIVSIDGSTGVLTAKASGIVKVLCTSTTDPSQSFAVTILVPGDYDRDGKIADKDAELAITAYFDPNTLSQTAYANELLDLDGDSEVTGEDADLMMSIFSGRNQISKK